MNKTYITTMPDKKGAFLKASEIISKYNGNITRVNYNKAVDLYTLFLEVSGEEKDINLITQELLKVGYLDNKENEIKVILIELKLMDVPGSVLPILKIINRFNLSISYISSQDSKTEYQYFKIGLLIEKIDVVKKLLDEISKLCQVKILEYDYTKKILDNTVFYINFSGEIRRLLNLSQETANEFLINSNKIMQLLDEKEQTPFKTFKYIKQFANFIINNKGTDFNPNIYFKTLDNMKLVLIEPPCGSNIFIFEKDNKLLFVDGGFCCYSKDILKILKGLYTDFNQKEKLMLLTHCDVDHVGITKYMDRVYLSRECYNNFVLENEGKNNFREQNITNEPYNKISRIISEYVTPPLDKMVIIGEKTDDEPFSKIGEVNLLDLKFSAYEGNGGHINGETVYICEEKNLALTGDNLVNIKGFSKQQAEFNILAPYLMSSVNINSKKATVIRNEIIKKTPNYLIFPGHGLWYENQIVTRLDKSNII